METYLLDVEGVEQLEVDDASATPVSPRLQLQSSHFL